MLEMAVDAIHPCWPKAQREGVTRLKVLAWLCGFLGAKRRCYRSISSWRNYKKNNNALHRDVPQ